MSAVGVGEEETFDEDHQEGLPFIHGDEDPSRRRSRARRTRHRLTRVLAGYRQRPYRLLVAGLAVGAGLLAGCGDDPGTSRSDSTVPGGAASAATTTTLPPADTLTLKGDGIGSFRFGDPAAALTAGLDAAFGAPMIDTHALEPIDGGHYSVRLGAATDPANALIYAHPALQVRCYGNGLCLVLGGASASDLRFTGWTYAPSTEQSGLPLHAEPLHTDDGVAIGSSTADFPGTVRRIATQCYSSFGVANEDGTIKARFDDYSEDRPREPAPGTPLAIVSMSAGTVTMYGDGCA